MIMDYIKKAEDLILKYGLETSHKVVDEIITELQEEWNQDRIDFYLDVKLYLDSK
jgi:hypothetical protein